MFIYLAEDKSEAERVLSVALGTLLKRPVEQLRERLLIGSPEACAEKLAAYQAAGVQRVFVWPIIDEIEHLAVFQHKLVALIDAVSKDHAGARHAAQIHVL